MKKQLLLTCASLAVVCGANANVGPYVSIDGIFNGGDTGGAVSIGMQTKQFNVGVGGTYLSSEVKDSKATKPDPLFNHKHHVAAFFGYADMIHPIAKDWHFEYGLDGSYGMIGPDEVKGTAFTVAANIGISHDFNKHITGFVMAHVVEYSSQTNDNDDADTGKAKRTSMNVFSGVQAGLAWFFKS